MNINQKIAQRIKELRTEHSLTAEAWHSDLSKSCVPSISLLGQTLNEWTSEATEKINAICICSDPEASKKKSKDEDQDLYSVTDLALPASTNVSNIIKQFNDIKKENNGGIITVSLETNRIVKELPKLKF